MKRVQEFIDNYRAASQTLGAAATALNNAEDAVQAARKAHATADFAAREAASDLCFAIQEGAE